jgi:hypothetical protein
MNIVNGEECDDDGSEGNGVNEKIVMVTVMMMVMMMMMMMLMMLMMVTRS